MNQSKYNVGKTQAIFVIFFCCLLLCLVHIHNGFPLIMIDTIAYLRRAALAVETSHKSNTYIAFLLSNFKFFNSIQFVVVIQNIIVVVLLSILSKTYIKKFNSVSFICLMVALLFTTLPWISNLMLSDIFTPITIITLILILDRQVCKLDYIFLIPLAFIGITSHQSHLLTVPIFTVMFLVLKYIGGSKLKEVLFSLTMIMLLIITSNVFEKNIFNRKVNPNIDKKTMPDISSGYYFVVVRIAESGELQHIVEQFCDGTKSNYLCSDSEEFGIPRVKSSPAGTRNTTNKSYIEYSKDNKEFVFYAMRSPRFYLGLARLTVKRGFAALKDTRLALYTKLSNERSALFESTVEKINPNDSAAFRNSNQRSNIYYRFHKGMYITIDKFWWYIVLPLTFFMVLYFYIRYQGIFALDYKHIIFFLILGHIINTLVCGTFSNFENRRYSGRTLWLVNLAIIFVWIQLLQFITKRKSSLS